MRYFELELLCPYNLIACGSLQASHLVAPAAGPLVFFLDTPAVGLYPPPPANAVTSTLLAFPWLG